MGVYGVDVFADRTDLYKAIQRLRAYNETERSRKCTARACFCYLSLIIVVICISVIALDPSYHLGYSYRNPSTEIPYVMCFAMSLAVLYITYDYLYVRHLCGCLCCRKKTKVHPHSA